jgi:DNA-binding PadR family transcriptional regulator
VPHPNRNSNDGLRKTRRLIAAVSVDFFKEGTIYPVTSRIVPSYSGPPRRYYRMTDQDRSVLAEWSAIWAGTRNFVDGFIAKGPSP